MTQDMLFEFNGPVDHCVEDTKLVKRTKEFLRVLSDAKYRLSVSEEASELLKEWNKQ